MKLGGGGFLCAYLCILMALIIEEGRMKRKTLLFGALGFFLFVQATQAQWTPAKRLTWNSGSSYNSAIAIDSTSTVPVVWYDDTPTNAEIHYKSGK